MSTVPCAPSRGPETTTVLGARAGARPVSPRLRELVAARTPWRSLDAAFYTDPEVFALDMAAVFGRHWIFAATDAEIPEPGDYVTVDFGPYSVIVLRDDDEQVGAFHNVCRHRGARILSGGRVHPEAEEGVDYDVDTLTHVWNATNRQDGSFVEMAQRGVSNPAYVPGPYSPVEFMVEAFVSWYATRLQVHIDAAEGSAG